MTHSFFSDNVPVVPAPADPWAGHTREAPIVQRMAGQVYGRVYELILADRSSPRDTYVGKCRTTIHERVWGRSSSAHGSPQSIAKDPWKARILPGRQGYRQLEVVYATGDDREDERTLRRAEADWIQRLAAEQNQVRPVKPVGEHAARRKPARPRKPPPRKPMPRSRMRLLTCLLFMAVATFLAARLITAMQLPWPAVPWVVSPVIGVALGYLTFIQARRALRRITR